MYRIKIDNETVATAKSADKMLIAARALAAYRPSVRVTIDRATDNVWVPHATVNATGEVAYAADKIHPYNESE